MWSKKLCFGEGNYYYYKYIACWWIVYKDITLNNIDHIPM